ncbi:hypothetical protein [Clostridium thermarum]|uniref:hypothetical protein n=1 Tax=Clostridium thermarum TaxID=1716543 RepID=UPI0013D75F5E|nr:hypothetical protein [Clostridium thermarum]
MSWLEELCFKGNIKIEYLKDKVMGKPQGKHIIKVHEVFKTCPYEVADAVIKYYSDPDKNKEEIRIILDFLKEICSQNNTSDKNNNLDTEKEEEKIQQEEHLEEEKTKEEEIEEVNIASIDIESVAEDKEVSFDDQVIKLQGSNVVELKIMVTPPSYISKGGEDNGIQIKENRS